MKLDQLDLPFEKLPKPVKCKHGHSHMNRRVAEECEERTLRALCAQWGLDYEAELGREPPRLPAGPAAIQEEMF